MAGRAPHLTRCSALFAAAHDPAVDGMAAVGKECGDTDERKVRPASQRRNRSGSAKPTKSSPVSECEQGGQRPRHAADFASCGRIEQHRFLSPPTEEPGMPQQRGSAGARLPIEERGGAIRRRRNAEEGRGADRTDVSGKDGRSRMLKRNWRNFHIFDCASDTAPRKKSKRACIFLSAYSYL